MSTYQVEGSFVKSVKELGQTTPGEVFLIDKQRKQFVMISIKNKILIYLLVISFCRMVQ